MGRTKKGAYKVATALVFLHVTQFESHPNAILALCLVFDRPWYHHPMTRIKKIFF